MGFRGLGGVVTATTDSFASLRNDKQKEQATTETKQKRNCEDKQEVALAR
jgi:hypothetical protein